MGQCCSLPSRRALSEAAAAPAGAGTPAPPPPPPPPLPPPPPPASIFGGETEYHAAYREEVAQEPGIGGIDPGLTLLSCMGSVSHNPLTALVEAAQYIAAAAGAHAVGISAYLDGEPQRSVLIASYGDGAGAFDRNVVMTGPGWAAAAAAPMAGRLCIRRPAEGSEEQLPADAACMFASEPRVTRYEAVSVRPMHGPPAGCIMAAYADGRIIPAVLTIAAVGVLPLLRQPVVGLMGAALESIAAAPDVISTISALLQEATSLMGRATNLDVAMRLALLPDGPKAAEALLFESGHANATMQRRNCLEPRKGCTSAEQPDNLSVRYMEMEGSFLSQALGGNKAWVVKDTAMYMQNTLRAAQDLLPASGSNGSLAVVPLFRRGEAPCGAFYVCPTCPMEVNSLQDILLGVIPCFTGVLCNQLEGCMEELVGLVAKAKIPGAKGSARPVSLLVLPSLPATHAPPGNPADAASGSGVNQGQVEAETPMTTLPYVTEGPDCRVTFLNHQQLATPAMIKVLAREIQRSRRHSQELTFLSDLTLISQIGRGGYGTVYAGIWRNQPAAIKVMGDAPNNTQLHDAVEMAVMTSVGHPNIVQLFTCMPNMAEVYDSAACSSASLCSPTRPVIPDAPPEPPLPSFRRVKPGESGVPTFNVLVMELCDRGSLRTAIKAGTFHKEGPSGQVHLQMMPTLEVLIEVATAMQFLHDSASLIHGDIKLDNVLLKSDPGRVLGFTTKLTDFGLSKVVSNTPEAQIVNIIGAGTINHLAPEMFVRGSAITPAVDAYAFGVLMWELVTSYQAFGGMKQNEIACAVTQGTRPVFPPEVPPQLTALAARCWLHDPEARPTFADIIRALRPLRGQLPEVVTMRLARGAAGKDAAAAGGAPNAPAAPAAPTAAAAAGAPNAPAAPAHPAAAAAAGAPNAPAAAAV